MRSRDLAAFWLAAVLALGLLHGLTQARLRPLFQVSDELAYIFGAQQAALAGASSAQAACISPPDGTLLDAGQGGGKWAFQAVTGVALAYGCRNGGVFPLFLLRAANALSLAVVALCVWLVSRLLWPERLDVAVLAGLLATTHPVLVKYGSGVTPDAWANAFAALAFLMGTRLVLGRGGWLDGAALTTATALALIWKESSTFLLVHFAAVIGVIAWRRVARFPPVLRMAMVLTAIAALAASGAAVVARLLPVFGTAYNVNAGITRSFDAPMVFARALTGDLLALSPGMLASTWTALGSAGAMVIPPSTTSLAIGLLTGGAVVLGLVTMIVRPRPDLRVPPAAVAIIWGLSAFACLLQPSLRQVWLDGQDIHQGRWLFPLAVPFCAWAAAAIVALRPASGWFALPVVTWVTVMWLTLGQLGSWYYTQVPGEVARERIFLRAAGGHDVGDLRIWALVQDVATGQAASILWVCAVLLCACSVAILCLVAPLAAHSGHD